MKIYTLQGHVATRQLRFSGILNSHVIVSVKNIVLNRSIFGEGMGKS